MAFFDSSEGAEGKLVCIARANSLPLPHGASSSAPASSTGSSRRLCPTTLVNATLRAMNTADEMIRHAHTSAIACDALNFGAPVAYIYNPLDYALSVNEQYLRRFGS